MNLLIQKIKETYAHDGVKGLLQGAGRKARRTAHAAESLLRPSTYFSVPADRVLTNEDLRTGCVDSRYTGRFWLVPSSTNDTSVQEVNSRNPFPESVPHTELRRCGYTYRPDFVRECHDVRFLGPDGIGITPDGLILQDTVQPPGEYDPGYRRVQRSVGNALDRHFLVSFESIFGGQRPKRRAALSLGTACSLQNCFINYYHWILEQLPKLRAVEHYIKQTGIEPTLILPPDASSFVHETLALLGVNESSCIEWQGPVLDVETLIVPSFPEANADNLHWLRTRLRRAVPHRQDSASVPKRIYVSRKGAKNHRDLRNEDEVLDALRRYGFERVFAEDYSVAEQIQIFSKARVIAGPHGAGLTNMIWTDEATIIEFHNHVIRDYFYVLAKNTGHDYIPVMAQSTDPHYLNSDIIVDTDDLENKLNKIPEWDSAGTSIGSGSL